MDFIALRACGKIQTNAQYIREFIRNHPSYKRDSKVPEDAAYDMVMQAKKIGEGLVPCPEILGPYRIPKCRPACNPFAAAAMDDDEIFAKAGLLADEQNEGKMHMCMDGFDSLSEASGQSEKKVVSLGTNSNNIKSNGNSSSGQKNQNASAQQSPGTAAASTTANTPSFSANDMASLLLMKNIDDSGQKPGTSSRSNSSDDNNGSKNGNNAKKLERTQTYSIPNPSSNLQLAAIKRKWLLDTYLNKAKERREQALRHDLTAKRKEMARMKEEIEMLESDMAAAEMTGHRELPNLSADRLVSAQQVWANRKASHFGQ